MSTTAHANLLTEATAEFQILHASNFSSKEKHMFLVVHSR
jgi:hypothetical protein